MWSFCQTGAALQPSPWCVRLLVAAVLPKAAAKLYAGLARVLHDPHAITFVVSGQSH
jgi:hypothetical protein